VRKKLFQLLVIAFSIGFVIYGAFYVGDFNAHVYRNLKMHHFLWAPLLFVAMIGISVLTGRIFPWSNWWIGSLIKREAPRDNMIMLPVSMRLVWIPYTALLLFALPTFATSEELFFREGVVKDLPTAILFSVIFGVAHLVAGVRLHVAFALCFAGFLFSGLYLGSGIADAALFHTTYNIFAVSLGVLALQWRRIAEQIIAMILYVQVVRQRS